MIIDKISQNKHNNNLIKDNRLIFKEN